MDTLEPNGEVWHAYHDKIFVLIMYPTLAHQPTGLENFFTQIYLAIFLFKYL